MAVRWSPVMTVSLAIAPFLAFVWLLMSPGMYAGRFARESVVLRSMTYGVAFEHYGSGVSPHAPRWRSTDPMSRRMQWGLYHEAQSVGAVRNDRVYVSHPWLLGLTTVPIAGWIVAACRRPRRRVTGKCPNCNYDVGATPQRCPECGQILRPPSLLDRAIAFDWLSGLRRHGRGDEARPHMTRLEVTDAPAAPAAGPEARGADGT